MPISLTIWTVENFSPSNENDAGLVFKNQLDLFDQNHPEAQLDIIEKKPTGPGSIEAYLEIAGQVAPAVLPDITVLSTDLIPVIGKMQPPGGEALILQPLDALVAPELIDDLFPIARQLGSYDSALMGIPFMLDFEHVIYNSTILTDTAPTTWDAILKSGGPCIFPAAEDAPVDTTLLHYISAGGALYDDEGNGIIEIDPLTEVFRFYQQADTDHIIPVSVIQTRSLAQSWNGYRNGNALLAHVNASQYLLRRDELLNTAVGPFPGMERSSPAFASGWVWAIITTDPARQQLALELINWLMDAERLGEWSYNGKWLPATENALETWPSNDEYVQFAREQIMIAMPRPDNDYYELVQTRLAKSVRDVLLGNTSPAAAASYSAP
jgi:ABC-type glycerol-3-phosphate transport system substrate-binding protein